MDRISEKNRENDESVVSLIDKVQKPFEEETDLYTKIDDLDKEQGFLRTKSEQALNIGLSAFSEINLLKNKIKALEQSIPILPTHKVLKTAKKDLVSDAQTEQIFNELAKRWKEETVNLSSMQKISMNNAYLQIIGLGPVAIRLILNELKRAPDFWFCALRALTRTNPVPPEMSGDINAMTKVWLDWGQKHGYP
jgi:hypothetical protein